MVWHEVLETNIERSHRQRFEAFADQKPSLAVAEAVEQWLT